jgi:hypothetical protein
MDAMEGEAGANEALQFANVAQVRLEMLMNELTKRVMVVQEDALTHLMDRGVIAAAARDGCCKPDGGTCCPNARTRLDIGANPVTRGQL